MQSSSASCSHRAPEVSTHGHRVYLTLPTVSAMAFLQHPSESVPPACPPILVAAVNALDSPVLFHTGLRKAMEHLGNCDLTSTALVQHTGKRCQVTSKGCLWVVLLKIFYLDKISYE